jgi:23S rRNA-/tRNA-specific pseudouridylate synthase
MSHAASDRERVVSPSIEVAFEDSDYFFVVKPPGLVCTGEAGEMESFHQLVKAFAVGAYGYQSSLLHRLDKGTSGLMCYAKRQEAAAHYLKLQDVRGAITKQYLAVVHGAPPKQAGRVEGGICKSSDLRTFVVRSKKSGKPVLTTYKVLRQVMHPDFGPVASLSLRLFTGRKHQIRASCRTLGCSIVGDVQYGGGAHHTMLLHAHRIAFTGAGGAEYNVSISPPETWGGFSALVLPLGIMDSIYSVSGPRDDSIPVN